MSTGLWTTGIKIRTRQCCEKGDENAESAVTDCHPGSPVCPRRPSCSLLTGSCFSQNYSPSLHVSKQQCTFRWDSAHWQNQRWECVPLEREITFTSTKNTSWGHENPDASVKSRPSGLPPPCSLRPGAHPRDKIMGAMTRQFRLTVVAGVKISYKFYVFIRWKLLWVQAAPEKMAIKL